MFKLTDKGAKIKSTTAGKLFAGDEIEVEHRISFEVTGGIELLDMFSTELHKRFYTLVKKEDLDMVDTANGVGEALKITYPRALNTEEWKDQLTGYRLSIPYGIHGERDLVFVSCTVDTFKIKCADGPAVTLGFRVRFKINPDAKNALEEAGAVSFLPEYDRNITIEPMDSKQAAFDDFAEALQ